MNFLIRRTCTIVDGDESRNEFERSSSSLEDYRDTPAYVLLGAPGAGKTKAFEKELAEHSNGHYVTARDFITFRDKPEWHGATLFIDGLDETRASTGDGRTPLDAVRRKLDALGKPRFRLSCREAHWFGANDSSHLKTVSPDNEIMVLHLDPLSEDDIREILHRSPEIDDAQTFMAAANERGIGGLLANPMNLKLLTKVVAGGVWPESRMRTFELACRELVREHNTEHQLAAANGHDVSHLMDVAGQLCAHQLLTGRIGYALLPGSADDHEFLDLEQFPGDERLLLRQVLDTKLFATPPADSAQGRAVPIHRHIAEFMAARHLASLIDDGLPIGRILALITGHDGGVVSEMRGLFAWLAAHSKMGRAELIARDPLGTILHGDVVEFTTDEKCRLLDAVEKKAAKYPWIAGTLPQDARLGDLVTPDMAEPFRRLLSASARDHARQPLALILLAMLRQGPAISELADILMEIIRDAGCHPSIRRETLDIYMVWSRDDEPSGPTLGILLSEVAAGAVADADDDLLGTLLSEMYPAKLSISQILPYLRTPKAISYIGRFSAFWTKTVLRESSHSQLAELLDSITNDFDRLRPALVGAPGAVSFLRRLPMLLLNRILDIPHAELSSNRLFNWLGVVSDPALQRTHYETETIRLRLRRDARLLEGIIGRAVEHCSGSSTFVRCMHGLERRFLQVSWPPHWCLEQAVSAADCDVAEYFVHRVADYVHGNPHDAALSRHSVESRLKRDKNLLRAFSDRLAVLAEDEAQKSRLRSQHYNDRARLRREWHNSLLPHLPSLRENHGQRELLHRLAQAYFGDFADVEGDSPVDRLRDLVGDDEQAVQAAFDGLRQSLCRSDLPSEDEILALSAENRFFFLSLPFMAGLEEAIRSVPNDGAGVTEKQMRLGLTIYFADPNISLMHYGHGWLSSVLRARPDVVADVLVRCARPLMRGGKNLGIQFFDLARSPSHAVVARLASIPLLQAFPTRCTKSQLGGLGFLLQAALLHNDVSRFLELAQRKLARRSMNTSQRGYWLVASLLASPDTYLKTLETYVVGSEHRVRHVAEFLSERRFPTSLLELLDPPALQLLVRVLGTSCRPRVPPLGKEMPRIDHEMQVSDRVGDLINRLASSPSPIAGEAIQVLSSDDALRPWRTHLVHAEYRQNAFQRETHFWHSDIRQVFEVLANERPANAADLAALTMAYLREIARKTRDGNTSDWRQYWNVDSHNRPLDPKPEDACRDVLLSDLQARLTGLHVDAQPEGRYADGKRSDIRISCGELNVPVEIKRNSHRDIWSAVRTQLIAKYARDAGAAGYGIYLVFWFGAGKVPPPESGTVPKHPSELEKRLQATLSTEEARLISICVVDVSPPE